MDNKTHLCSSCRNIYPNCNPENITFGNGVGDDNIISCEIYEAIEYRHPKDDGSKI